MLGNATQPVGQRLASLDVLRGFDLFLLVFYSLYWSRWERVWIAL